MPHERSTHKRIEELRDEFRNLVSVEISYSNDKKYTVNYIKPEHSKVIADWWIEKLLSREQELYDKMEEMKYSVPVLLGTSEPTERVINAVNQTLSDCQALLDVEQKHE